MSIEYIEGDLFAGVQKDNGPGTIIIPHVCNDQRKFGAGFVVPLAKHYPMAKSAYMDWPRKDEKDDSFSLSNVQFVIVQNHQKTIHDEPITQIVVANMIAQTLGGKRPLFYNHLSTCMDKVAKSTWPHDILDGEGVHPNDGGNVRIACPMFGSGLAGGDWNFVEKLIEDCWVQIGIPVTVYYLKNFIPNNWEPPN